MQIQQLQSIKYIVKYDFFEKIIPNKDNFWINQGDKLFEDYTPLSIRNSTIEESIFGVRSLGISTNRDVWSYNFSRKILADNTKNERVLQLRD